LNFFQICAKSVSKKYFGSKTEKEKGEKKNKKGRGGPNLPKLESGPRLSKPQAQTGTSFPLFSH
jgi:hypothetical protein